MAGTAGRSATGCRPSRTRPRVAGADSVSASEKSTWSVVGPESRESAVFSKATTRHSQDVESNQDERDRQDCDRNDREKQIDTFTIPFHSTGANLLDAVRVCG